jgi:hypothetical protein
VDIDELCIFFKLEQQRMICGGKLFYHKQWSWPFLAFVVLCLGKVKASFGKIDTVFICILISFARQVYCVVLSASGLMKGIIF